jgi:hypothetical protein
MYFVFFCCSSYLKLIDSLADSTICLWSMCTIESFVDIVSNGLRSLSLTLTDVLSGVIIGLDY